MLTRIKTATLVGIDGYGVTVETDLHRGMPAFHVVGLADTTIKEACRRIKPAILNSGFSFPNEKVTVNLVPAGRPKEGSHFDLPIALGILTLGWEREIPSDTAFLGELSLDGRINRIRGALPLTMVLRKTGIKRILLPWGNAEEAAILEDVEVLPVKTLREAAEYLQGLRSLGHFCRSRSDGGHIKRADRQEDFSQVAGQESVKRALTVAAAGNHGLLLVGGPGCGKTMMARRIPTILPELTYEEKLEITRIYSVAGLLTEAQPIVEKRPFRSPHHTISAVGLTGGGNRPRPGELSLAHGGVLFLDELGEFDNRAIDAMRQPVEEGRIQVSRNLEEISFPCRVMIVAAANPCKCGHLWDPQKLCSCTARQLDSHRRRLTGPFSDRIDLHVKVLPVSREELAALRERRGVSSADMREQVRRAREFQARRYAGTPYGDNGSLDEKGVEAFCRPDSEGEQLLAAAYDRMGLSMRAYGKLLKVSRTAADLEGEEKIQKQHIAEALLYRIGDGEDGTGL